MKRIEKDEYFRDSRTGLLFRKFVEGQDVEEVAYSAVANDPFLEVYNFETGEVTSKKSAERVDATGGKQTNSDVVKTEMVVHESETPAVDAVGIASEDNGHKGSGSAFEQNEAKVKKVVKK